MLAIIPKLQDSITPLRFRERRRLKGNSVPRHLDVPQNLEPCQAQAVHGEALAAHHGCRFHCCDRAAADVRSLSLVPP